MHERRAVANFHKHPLSVTASAKVKLVRYQENPKHWGPGKKASAKTAVKRKRSTDELEEPPAKH